MPNRISEFRMTEPDTGLIANLTVAENLLLAMAAGVAALNVLGWLAPAAIDPFRTGWSPMGAEAAVAAFLMSLSLALCNSRFDFGRHVLSAAIAAIVATGSALVLVRSLTGSAPAVVSHTASWAAKGMSPHAAVCFTLLGLATAFSRARLHLKVIADLLTCLLLFIVGLLVAGQLIGMAHPSGNLPAFAMAGQTAFCLLLLTLVVFFRRMEGGIFSILLGRGIGSKVARFLIPLVLVGPYFREVVRARMLATHLAQQHYLSALLASVAVSVGVAILLYLAWRLNALESEIQGLSLRDALTGLYNLRGFRLLSEQALLLAHRSGQPFSVLFIDVDNLKQINDALGHQTGSELLAATAQILREAFRETDVLGRIGGDEFAVAGQFSEAGIAESVQRLRQSAMLYNASSANYGLRFSAGWVTSNPDKRDVLADLLAKADEEMYREKRRRKAAAAGRGKRPLEAEPTELLPR